MRVHEARADRDFKPTPPPPPSRIYIKPSAGALVSLLDQLDAAGVSEAGVLARQVEDRLAAMSDLVEARPDRHATGLLGRSPDEVAEALRVAATERAIAEVAGLFANDFGDALVSEVTVRLQGLADPVGDQLHGEFDAALQVVTAAAAAGIGPWTTAATVVAANDDVLSDAWRALPPAVARLNAVAALVDALLDVAVIVAGTEDWPPHHRGMVRMPMSDGSTGWVADPRTGGRWLAWVIEQSEPDPNDDPGPMAA